MVEVAPGLWVGTVAEARIKLHTAGWAIANVAKTLHLDLHGWKNSDPASQHYILHETPEWISLNWVDAADPALFDYRGAGVERVHAILAWISRSLIAGKQVLICCDTARSRSPSVALLYLAKYLHTIPDSSYVLAQTTFSKLYPSYEPGKGIAGFLKEKWEMI